MVHELLEIHNGRVDLSKVPENRPELSVCNTLSYSLVFLPSNEKLPGNHTDNKYRSILSS